MQIGIDLGATKIEYVVLKDNGDETNRARTECPRDYQKIILEIKNIVNKLDKEFDQTLPIEYLEFWCNLLPPTFTFTSQSSPTSRYLYHLKQLLF